MPETTVNEDDRFPFGEYEVRLSGQPFVVQAEPQAQPMEDPPDDVFRASVLSPDLPHDFGAALLGEHVHR
jgi:hypothetical protein